MYVTRPQWHNVALNRYQSYSSYTKSKEDPTAAFVTEHSASAAPPAASLACLHRRRRAA